MEAQPFLKWAGGKSRLLSQYRPWFPQTFGHYYEPFLGGGAVFFWLCNRFGTFEARLSDANADLVELYQVVQSQPAEIISRLKRYQEKHCENLYYKTRQARPRVRADRAARLVYLNKTCFNGLYRVNSKGQFNVPMGRYKNPSILQEGRILAASQALRQASLSVQHFESAVTPAVQGDLVYFDPPYVPLSTTSNFTSYTRDSFDAQAQGRLAEVFAELDARGCQVLLSNSDTPQIRELYQGFRLVEIRAPRMINSKAELRQPVGELLVLGHRLILP